MLLNPEIQSSIKKCVLCWLATASADGQPNVSPKEVFCTEGDSHLLIANIASPNSLRNIRQNPLVCVSLVDIFVQKGWKLYGSAEIIENVHPNFESWHAPLYTIAGPDFPILSVLRVTVTRTAAIIAPGYYMRAQTTEASQIASAMESYGVHPRA
ncbi:MAG TPA: pyridoxamine 5'-phosphate oxidase family protein [Anaerolineales bacterium]|nr:pyridoxamine 5'-phosphate oxidase family protein [Anaerolineales bacterium]